MAMTLLYVDDEPTTSNSQDSSERTRVARGDLNVAAAGPGARRSGTMRLSYLYQMPAWTASSQGVASSCRCSSSSTGRGARLAVAAINDGVDRHLEKGGIVVEDTSLATDQAVLRRKGGEALCGCGEEQFAELDQPEGRGLPHEPRRRTQLHQPGRGRDHGYAPDSST